MELYWERAKRLHIVPNHWLGEGYLKAIDAKELVSHGRVYLMDSDEVQLFPSLPVMGPLNYRSEGHWSDFMNLPGLGEAVDLEYVYLAPEFYRMEGGKWAVFRKNSRKWSRANEGHTLEYRPGPIPTKDMERVLLAWLEARDPEEVIEDDSTLLRIVTEPHLPEARAGLYRDGELVGFNVWDLTPNPVFCVYRYCIGYNEPWLSEHLRLLFYLNSPRTMVNDGGVLGNPGLKQFKDKLNPTYVRTVRGGKR